ncbi:MAG: 30S ribosomal protein S18 [Fimbriimonas ginsengisoli]|uniref:Small ribosomal subunit protein bS18 n=1 Tax=Fimbriimonas ginsengisoli TaxID=1005039 RepID=A0A931LRJ7_FIMGI|nr:30S ribosomal protein S18 [Fimbriimonas ginsengisoli]MBI3721751.1 30S ribosomal protein S18 [Fimbriimonas ginsengisoli]
MSEEVTRPRGDSGYAPRGDKDAPPSEPRFKGRRRRKVSFLTIQKIDYVDYKDVATLRRFLNDRGKILASRQTGNTAGQQRMITRAIHRAREMALLPFVVIELSDRRDHGPRRDRGPRDRDYAPREQAPREEAPREEAPVEPVAVAPAEEPAVDAAAE